MKYYGPVKTALVIIPPENLSDKITVAAKKETVLLKLRQYLASFAAFVVGVSGIYLAEKSQAPNEVEMTAPQMAAKTMAPAGESLHDTGPASQTVTPAPSVPEPSLLLGEPTMILIAVAGGIAMFIATFFIIRFYVKKRKIKKILNSKS